MCRRRGCPECGKPTFAGCGMHIEQVLGDVPKEKRCQGHAAPQPSNDPTKDRKGWWPFG
ncbi:MAG: hypothetical protein U0325_01380 [Polyangiales bacterium]